MKTCLRWNSRQLLLLLLLLASGCRESSPAGLPITHMRIGGQDFTLEIARSEHEMSVGLMHRESLDPDHGMIFSYTSEDQRTFWNHDVHFPLDLLFLGSNGTVVSIKAMESYSDKNVGSGVPAQYVIELLGGTAKKLNVSTGDQLTLPQEAR